MWFTDPAHLASSIMMLGLALIFWFSDRRNRSSRLLCYCLGSAAVASGITQSGSPEQMSIALMLIAQIAETLTMLFGTEWGRQLGLDSQGRGRLRLISTGLFRASQIMLLVFGGLAIGYLLLFPEHATRDAEGLIKVQPVEFAVFAPLLGTGLLLMSLATIFLLFSPIDPAERIRLRSLLIVAPLFGLSMIVSERWEPLMNTICLLIFLAGSVRYLMIQSQRGLLMRQFVSPEVAAGLHQGDATSSLRRQRREITVLACDLRGFTAYAQQADSDQVVELLERYYARVGEIAATHGGTVKDHAGDGILILLGAPEAIAAPAQQAFALAQQLLNEIPELLRHFTDSLGIGAGLATGEATIGAIQGAGRLEYVAVGNVVNLAARLCDQAPHGSLLMDERSLRLTGVDSLPARQLQLKGFRDDMTAYQWAASPA